ncbi:MAG: hypothetical protein AAFP89_25030 [Bacteroidota bacterium]
MNGKETKSIPKISFQEKIEKFKGWIIFAIAVTTGIITLLKFLGVSCIVFSPEAKFIISPKNPINGTFYDSKSNRYKSYTIQQFIFSNETSNNIILKQIEHIDPFNPFFVGCLEPKNVGGCLHNRALLKSKEIDIFVPSQKLKVIPIITDSILHSNTFQKSYSGESLTSISALNIPPNSSCELTLVFVLNPFMLQTLDMKFKKYLFQCSFIFSENQIFNFKRIYFVEEIQNKSNNHEL